MKRNELIHNIRELVLQHYYGTFLTQGKSYPYGSLVRYSVDALAQPIFMLSRIAEHTKNLQHSKQVSLFILKPNKENIQECERVTLMGTLEELDKNHPHFNNCLQNYIAYFPETQYYLENLDFDLYQLQVERCAYVGGFAAAHEITGNDFRQLNPLDDEACSRIISHMNEDHADALTHYCHTFNINLNGHLPKLVAIDACGFQLRIGQAITRINFPEPISDRISAREALVAMAQR